MGKTTRRLLTAAVILFIFGISLLGWSLNELTKMRRMRRYFSERPFYYNPQDTESIFWWSEPEFIPKWARSAQSAGYLVPPEIWVLFVSL
jgi:hypothetical protein